MPRMELEQANKLMVEAQAASDRAMRSHQLAMTAFNVACARFDWKQAQVEHDTALFFLDSMMLTLVSMHQITEAAQP